MPENTVNKRKTFAIISHPDAGKTTLTEKLLLFGGAIQQAGEHFLHKDVKRTDGILQHDITGAGMELVGKGTDIMANIAVGDTDTFGPPGGT